MEAPVARLIGRGPKLLGWSKRIRCSGGDYFTRSMRDLIMRDLIRTYDPALVVLIETRISGAGAERDRFQSLLLS